VRFLDAVIDTLAPGDEVLPSGTAAGVRVDAAAHRMVLGAIGRTAGGEDAFAAAGAAARARAIDHIEREMPSELAALVLAVAEEYYDADAVVLALGWTVEPPQPNGHPLPAFDERLLAAVRRRRPFWRDGGPTR
jgi:hypothetical protein